MQVIALHPLTWLTRTLLHDLDEDDSALEVDDGEIYQKPLG